MTIWTGDSAFRSSPIAGRANEISVVPGADKMSAVPGRLGPPSSRRLTDPITSWRQRSEQTPSGPHRITPDSRQVWLPCLYPSPVNISPRCTPLAPASRVATRRHRAWLFLLAAPCARARLAHLAYRNIHARRVSECWTPARCSPRRGASRFPRSAWERERPRWASPLTTPSRRERGFYHTLGGREALRLDLMTLFHTLTIEEAF